VNRTKDVIQSVVRECEEENRKSPVGKEHTE
jgi:hypothetical protein